MLNFKSGQKIKLKPLEKIRKDKIKVKNLESYTNEYEIFGIPNEDYIEMQQNNYVYITYINNDSVFIKEFGWNVPFEAIDNSIKIPKKYFEI